MSKVSIIGSEYDVDMSIIKMEQIASHLVGLLRHHKISRSELAQNLGWSKGRVTKVLSGDVNLTIKTISTITQELGYDFDVVFHNKNYEKPKQPWQIDRERASLNHAPALKQHVLHTDGVSVMFQLETGEEVVDSVLAGAEKDFYISVSLPSRQLPSNQVPIIPQVSLSDQPVNITYLKQDMKALHHD